MRIHQKLTLILISAAFAAPSLSGPYYGERYAPSLKTQMEEALVDRNYGRIKFLLESGADPDIPDQDGNYPLMLMVESGAPAETIRAAVEHGARADRRSPTGTTPLHASLERPPEVLRALLSGEAIDVEVKNRDGQSAWVLALALGREEHATILAKNGAGPNPLKSPHSTVRQLMKDEEKARKVCEGVESVHLRKQIGC